MARAEVQELIAKLTLQDQLSGSLAAAKQNLQGTEDQLGRLSATAKRTGSDLSGIASGLGSVAAAGAVAFAAFKVADFLGDSVQAAKDEEVGIIRLTASLKANVPAWNEDIAAIEKAIAARQRFGFDDDALRESLGSLVAVTHNVSDALTIQNTALDLARFAGISLQDATQRLVTVEAGRYRGLAQLGIQIRANATEQEALAAVQKVAGGQAEAFGNTTQGAFDKAATAVHNLQESIGTPLLGALAVVAQALADAAKGVGDFADAGANLIGTAQRIKDENADGWRIPIVADAIDAVTGAFHAVRDPADQWVASAKATAQAAQDAADAQPQLTGALAEVATQADATNGVLDGTRQAMLESEAQAESAGISFDKFALGLQGTTDTFEGGVEAEANWTGGLAEAERQAKEAAGSFSNMKDALDAIPTSVNIDINVKENIQATSLGAGATGTAPGGFRAGAPEPPAPAEASLPQANSLAAAQAAAEAAARKAQQAQDEAARKAKQAAEELAKAYRDKVSVEFDHAKKIADTLFDSLHDRITKAIKDAETLAQKQHDAALQAISDNLKAEQAAHAAPVNAAEAALAQRQAEEQRRNLVEAQQAAAQALRTNVDPTQTAQLQRSLRDATEALANFDAQAAIDRLKVVQAGLDAASQAKADAATKDADAKLAAAKAEAQKQQDAETLAAKKRKDDFETQLAALEKRDTALGKTPKQIQADIDALEQRFGITTDKLGFHHIEDPLVSAIKNVKIEPPPVTIINNQKFLLQVGANELRLIASALTTGNQPAATSSIRTGAAGRG